ncbi:MAG: hypothetical protein QOG69_462, partial [Actinomycetota bacterium]|nr:hypothetical protein [Actinomycetota bacterium]
MSQVEDDEVDWAATRSAVLRDAVGV